MSPDILQNCVNPVKEIDLYLRDNSRLYIHSIGDMVGLRS